MEKNNGIFLKIIEASSKPIILMVMLKNIIFFFLKLNEKIKINNS